MRKGKGKEAKLSYGAHALMENRNGLLVDFCVTLATGTAEAEAAEAMLKRQARKGIRPRTLGGDKGYDSRGFVALLRSRKITPHVAANVERRGGSAIDGRTIRHTGYCHLLRVLVWVPLRFYALLLKNFSPPRNLTKHLNTVVILYRIRNVSIEIHSLKLEVT
jgi:hypothetical protein